MLNGSLEILQLSAIAVIVTFLALRFLKRKKPRDFFESFQTTSSPGNAGIFERQRVAATKKCPGCEQQLPLAAIICEGCDYNFLAARPDRSHSMLPAPEPFPGEPEQQKIASAV
jgi:hypothetical protein